MTSFESWMSVFLTFEYVPYIIVMILMVTSIAVVIGYATLTLNVNENKVCDFDRRYAMFRSCFIQKVEHRGITINQLLFIQDEIKARCVKEGWTDKDGYLLTPERVNLYDIKYKIIMDRTSVLQCSYVELVAIGEQIPEWFVCHWLGEPVFAFIKCLIRHAKDRGLSWDTPYWISVSY